MKKNYQYIALIFVLTVYSALSQLNTNGTIVNRGTIQVKEKTIKQSGGNIDNKDGLIITTGTVTEFTQNTLMGRIDFSRSDPLSKQGVPQINYWDIRLFGESDKVLKEYSVDPTLNLTSLSRFYSDTLVQIKFDTKYRINTHGYVTHKGHINWGSFYGLVSMNGIDTQNIDGMGHFKELELDNFEGADVINNGGFKVNTLLELRRGEFRNSFDNNFAMLDTSMIIRWSGASILSAPIFEKTVDVSFKGNSAMDIGPEIPLDTNVLRDLFVENVGGITLTRDATANRDIVVSTVIKTEPDSSQLYVLTLTSQNDPQYTTPDAEVIGSFRRKNLRYDNTKMLYNNRYTYILFGNRDDANGITEMTMRVRPKVLPPNGEVDTKVVRDFFISAKDSNYADVPSAIKFELGYGWRHSPGNQARHETGDLDYEQVMLQRWNDPEWVDNTSSVIPNLLDGTTEWAYSRATNVSELGQFALGMSAEGQLAIYAFAVLEGAYRWGSMATDLFKKGLIPNTPPDIYPHNLDKTGQRERSTIANLPENTVDWIMLEFSKMDSGMVVDSFYRHCVLLSDGTIYDSNGTQIKIQEKGNYRITVRHRNHLAVMTADSIRIYPSKPAEFKTIDFRNEFAYGIPTITNTNENLRVLKDKDGNQFYALVAGDANHDGLIDLVDYDQDIWGNRDDELFNPISLEFPYYWDITLSGIVHTRDYNMSWNNLGKKSMVQYK